MREVEILLVDCKDWFLSSMAAGWWKVDDSGTVVDIRAGPRGRSLTDDTMAKFFAAADFLSRSDFSGAFKVLDLAFRKTGEMITLNVPSIVCLLAVIFSRLESRSQRDTLNIFRKYIQTQAELVVSENKMLASTLKKLSSLSVDKYDHVLPQLIDMMVDQSDELFGQGSNLSLDMFWFRYGAFTIREDVVGQIRSIKRELDKIQPDSPPYPWILRHKRLYAWKISQMKREQGKYDEAQAALRTVEHTYTDPTDVDIGRHWCFAGIIEEKRGDLAAAETYHRLSVKTSMRAGDDDAIQFSMFKLIQLLDMMGKNAEAERIRDYSRSLMSEIASQVVWNWEEFEERTAKEPITIPSPAETSSVT
jgi:hypothetical protein